MAIAAREVLGDDASHDEVMQVVQELYKILDTDGTGNITRDEALKAVGEIKRQTLLGCTSKV